MLEEMQKQRLTLDDGFGVIADDLDAVAEGLGFSLPDLDNSSSDGDDDEERPEDRSGRHSGLGVHAL